MLNYNINIRVFPGAFIRGAATKVHAAPVWNMCTRPAPFIVHPSIVHISAANPIQHNNYTMTNFPIKPEHHIDFSKHLERPSFYPSKLGPNPESN